MADTLYDIPLKTIDGKPASLGDYAGKVLLVVNVASKCGLTPQYEGLEALYKARRDEGLAVLGFPANDFGQQEPGTEAEIVEFCSSTYGVDFPMFEKMTVVGPEKHPLYDALTKAKPEAEGSETMRERMASRGRSTPVPEVLWNFEKFVVGRDGKVVARFSPDITPGDPRITAALDKALAQPA
jgi:glutathione peroxidase